MTLQVKTVDGRIDHYPRGSARVNGSELEIVAVTAPPESGLDISPRLIATYVLTNVIRWERHPLHPDTGLLDQPTRR